MRGSLLAPRPATQRAYRCSLHAPPLHVPLLHALLLALRTAAATRTARGHSTFKCTRGERVSIFSSPLSSNAKMSPALLSMLEKKL
jgi:hypothetical protein